MLIPYPLTRESLGQQLAAARLSFENAKRQLDALERIEIGCASCENYQGRRCLKWQATPPPEVVSAGCPEWVYDDIPF